MMTKFGELVCGKWLKFAFHRQELETPLFAVHRASEKAGIVQSCGLGAEVQGYAQVQIMDQMGSAIQYGQAFRTEQECTYHRGSSDLQPDFTEKMTWIAGQRHGPNTIYLPKLARAEIPHKREAEGIRIALPKPKGVITFQLLPIPWNERGQ